ncbi:hypothetical protein Ami103574_03165 [Aminipila butyrica]|uniref:Basal-body rod modification protein FlgD n=1 Tax=Aminipila butyrica TaxID=433296 RepID=A0A858BTF2_9FIRM|nr:flagellar hook capping FlgD N-terminal domain-containing protein [Aminipila butyrica]QIB68375.1 hypothetical protein Ami103574_03165 [Aminipila butyrica]
MADTTINDQILKSLKSLTADKSASKSLQSNIDLQTVNWLNLLVAQLKNQDMYNQTDNAEMMNQMAQYSQIQATQSMVDMQEDLYAMNTTSYATSLLGQNVTAASIETTTDSTGKTEKLVTTVGTVTGVTLFEGEPVVYIGDKAFSLSQIMIVGKVETGKETDNGGDTDTDPDTDDNKDDGAVNGGE